MTEHYDPPGPRVIWQCGGDGARWGFYRETIKQLCEFDPNYPWMPLLTAMVLRAKSHAPQEASLWVMGSDPVLHQWARAWRGCPVQMFEADPARRLGSDADKVWSSQELWSTDARTWLLMGDVYFSTDAVRAIFAPDQWTGVRWYGRRGASSRCSKPWREVFACSFMPEDHGAMLDACQRVHHAPGACSRGLWGVMAALNSQNLRKRPEPGVGWVEINDWTEDFDCPTELLDWQRYRFGTTIAEAGE